MTARRTIPQIRERLYELGLIHGIDELITLADETKRQFSGRRAPSRRRMITPEIAAAVTQHALEHPSDDYQKIAEHFGINAGRVSEIMFGKRGENR